MVEEADVVLEILDARDPLSSRCSEVEDLVNSKAKKLVLILNKIGCFYHNYHFYLAIYNGVQLKADNFNSVVVCRYTDLLCCNVAPLNCEPVIH